MAARTGDHVPEPPNYGPVEDRPVPVPVWVRLDAVYPHPSDAPQTSVPEGLDLVGNTPGVMFSGT